jgi:hypothetical protein
LGETPTFIQSPQNPKHNPLGRGRVLGLRKIHQNLGKSGDRRGLNSPNTLVPNIFLIVSGDLGFDRDYSH